MAKAKRKSDVSAPAGAKDASASGMTATPPYSSDGPTLPLINGEGENIIRANGDGHDATAEDSASDAIKRRKLQKHHQEEPAKKQALPVNTNHPSLYEPGTLLPRELLGPLLAQARLADVQNAVSIVFTKNQNIKGGVTRLKTYLGAHVDLKNPIDIPEVLKEKGSVIAISAQGEGTAKLVTIVDMAKRVVKPGAALPSDDNLVETWCMYMSLASVEVEQKKRIVSESMVHGKADSTQETEEEEAFEPMEIDAPAQKKDEMSCLRKVPVLTVWLSRQEITAFKEAFGEQTFTVLTLPKDD